MKNAVFTVLALFLFTAAQAQPQGAIWGASRSANVKANEVHTFFTSTYDAFLNGDEQKLWDAYTDEAAEIGPDGSITYGKQALREGWEAFMKMTDEKPKFSYSNVLVRMLSDDVALVTFDSEADIKIGGQQVGGKSKCMAVVRKIKGQWRMEFDTLTPMLGMPALDAAGKN